MTLINKTHRVQPGLVAGGSFFALLLCFPFLSPLALVVDVVTTQQSILAACLAFAVESEGTDVLMVLSTCCSVLGCSLDW